MDNKITADDLRGMLDEYSPEQQMEIDAQAIREGAKALSDISAQLKECIDTLPRLISDMQKATTLNISDESLADVVMSGEETGRAAAKAFKENVSVIIEKAHRSVKHVSCPANVALILLFLLFVLVLFTGIIVYLNCVSLDNDMIWKAIWLSGGTFIFLIVMIVFMDYMEWI